MSFNFDTMVSMIKESISTNTVIGEPMEFGAIKLIPVMSVYFGFGGGGGQDGRTDGKGGGSGAGGGGGARLHVTGFIVVKGDDVSFLPTGRGGAVEKIMDTLPELLDKALAKGRRSTNSVDSVDPVDSVDSEADV